MFTIIIIMIIITTIITAYLCVWENWNRIPP